MKQRQDRKRETGRDKTFRQIERETDNERDREEIETDSERERYIDRVNDKKDKTQSEKKNY